MRLFSNPESTEALEVSVLAIIETVVAASVSLYLAIYIFDSWTHIIIGCCIAPFLLLRTKQSTRLGVWLFNLKERIILFSLDGGGIFHSTIKLVILLPISFALVPLWAKVHSTLVNMLKRPRESFYAIPKNFFRICVCMDSAHVPELVPGIELDGVDNNLKGYRFGSITSSIKRRMLSSRIDFFTGLLVIPILCPAFLIAFLYRFSLKSTAIVWLPLLWIVPKLNPKESFKTRVELINKGSWGKFLFFFSIVTVCLFLGKLSIYYGLLAVSEEFLGLKQLAFDNFVAPSILPWWQLASAVNSMMTIVVFFLAGNVLILAKNNESYPLAVYDRSFRLVFAIRSLLSLYSIFCLFYIVASFISTLGLPPMGDRFFPWQ